jgi:hypothetical protein
MTVQDASHSAVCTADNLGGLCGVVGTSDLLYEVSLSVGVRECNIFNGFTSSVCPICICLLLFSMDCIK